MPEYVEARPGVMMGKLFLRGTVYLFVEKLRAGETARAWGAR